MAGKNRRTRCDQCKRLFLLADTIDYQKLQSYYKFQIVKRIFCSKECLKKFVGAL